MKVLLFTVVFAIYFTSVAGAFGTGEVGCSGDCTTCHKVTLKEAQDLVKKLDPGFDVEKIGPSPVPGLYQLVLSRVNVTQKGIAYLDFTKRYLIQGVVLDTGNKVDLTKKSILELIESQLVDPSRIPLDNALLLGNPQGKKHLYLFSDPDCPFCAKIHEQMLQLVKDMPDLAVHIILFPLSIHPDAAWKTNVIIAASKKDMGSALTLLQESYQKKPIQQNPGVKDYASELEKLGKDLGIVSTPTLVYPDRTISMGIKSLDEIKSRIGKEAKNAKNAKN